MSSDVAKFYEWARGKYVQFYLIEDDRDNLIECKICGEVQVVVFGNRVWSWTYHHLSEFHDYIITIYALANGKIEPGVGYY